MRCFLLVFGIFLLSAFVPAQEVSESGTVNDGLSDDLTTGLREEFWICFSADTAMYNTYGPSYGGALAVAYGRGISVGFKAAYYADPESLTDVLELCFLLRANIRGFDKFSGPFVQLTAGQAIFFRRESGLSVPASWGMISIGVNAGWRFVLGSTFFVEPFVRGGYPYFIGAGLGVGLKL